MWQAITLLSIDESDEVFQLAHCQQVNNTYGPHYGKTWLFFTDERGTPHFVNLSTTAQYKKQENIKIHFHLYTRRNPEHPESLEPYDKPIKSKYFNPRTKLKVITHGWLGSGKVEWLIGMKNVYLLVARKDYNVIIVDWQDLASWLMYPIAAFGTRDVGLEVAKFLSQLKRSYRYTGRRIHLLGFSLGAHVMGFAGQYSDFRISRITGLDPARPLFEFPIDLGPDNQLDYTDAVFVDIIHTSAGLLGYQHSHGHADFYPNRGEAGQPGCDGPQYTVETCSHYRAVEYFTESIYSDVGFVSYPCGNWQDFQEGKCSVDPTLLGEHTDTRRRRGDFYLYVNPQPPHAMGKKSRQHLATAGVIDNIEHDIGGTDSKNDDGS